MCWIWAVHHPSTTLHLNPLRLMWNLRLSSPLLHTSLLAMESFSHLLTLRCFLVHLFWCQSAISMWDFSGVSSNIRMPCSIMSRRIICQKAGQDALYNNMCNLWSKSQILWNFILHHWCAELDFCAVISWKCAHHKVGEGGSQKRR